MDAGAEERLTRLCGTAKPPAPFQVSIITTNVCRPTWIEMSYPQKLERLEA